MASRKQLFRTTNLDLGSVLMAQGYACATRRLGNIHSEFVFERNTDIDRIVPKFFKGEVEVNITAFLYARFALKRELSKKAIEWEKAKPGKLILHPGQFYYFIADDGKPYKNVYATREPHLQRVLNGNVFLTMNEAQVAASNTKAD